MNWLKKLFGRCDHKWKIFQRINVYGENAETPMRYDYILQCEKCGDLKKFRG